MPLTELRRTRAEIGTNCDEPALGLRLDYQNEWFTLELTPYGHDEPAWLEYEGVVKFKGAKHRFDGTGKWVVTRRRLLIVVRPGLGTSGLSRSSDEHALIAVDLEDLAAEKPVKTRRGMYPLVRLAGSHEPFTIDLLVADHLLQQFLEAIEPNAGVLDGRQAEEIRGQERETSDAVEAGSEGDVEMHRENGTHHPPPANAARTSSPRVLAGAAKLFDHHRTWHFQTSASDQECREAFRRAFSGGGPVLRARWKVAEREGGLVSVYEGRGGAMRVLSGLSARASSEQEGAIGSEVRFTVDSESAGRTTCTMWLAVRGEKIGFTNDARFIKPYMRAVETELRSIDPSVVVAKE